MCALVPTSDPDLNITAETLDSVSPSNLLNSIEAELSAGAKHLTLYGNCGGAGVVVIDSAPVVSVE